MDTLLVAILSIGICTLLFLSVAGHFYPQTRPPSDDGCGTDALRARISALLRRKGRLPSRSRFIAVVGDGVGGESVVVNRPYNTQFAQGYDLFQGFKHALGAPHFAEILSQVGFLYVDDGGNPACAERIAEILADQPELLGVIGHSTSSCTKKALPYYKRSNIPVIVPAATNTSLLVGHQDHSFRLPSNDTIQSLVIADLILNRLKGSTLFVVWDATPEAAEYSDFLKTNLQHYLTLLANNPASVVIEGSYPISLNPLNYSYLFRRIVSSRPDVVVFAGYGSLAREFLLGLDQEYSLHEGQDRPTVVLTDGCKIPGISGYSFPTYVAFPAAPLSDYQKFHGFNPGVPISRFQKMYLDESFEVFGYDAAVLLLTAIRSLHDNGESVSRQQIIKLISSQREWPTAQTYNFVGGENQQNRYYFYSLQAHSVAYSYDSNAVNDLLRQVETE